MKIVHIIDRYSKVNYGIWHAVTNTASALFTQFGYETYLVYPAQSELQPVEGIVSVPLQSIDPQSIDAMLSHNSFSPVDTIFITHGCWQYPTKWGAELKKRGYTWVYVPHGMLEPNSMGQKYWKKLVYFYLIERRCARMADTVRAVSQPEMDRHSQHFRSVIHIPNAVSLVSPSIKVAEASAKRQFLFMARIHAQKGVLELVRAWKMSSLVTSASAQLVIAGPDDGALAEMKHEIDGVANISYCGAKYGAEKEQLLRDSDFFVLPSRAEGFPGSVIEAMSYGVVPLITKECNFPEAISSGCAYVIERNPVTLASVLEQCMAQDVQIVGQLKERCTKMIGEHYSLETVAGQFHQLYSTLQNGK